MERKYDVRRFTLIDLIVSITIIGIIISIVNVNFTSANKESLSTALDMDILNVQMAVDMYLLEEGTLPTIDTPTVGNPQKIDLNELVGEYLKYEPIQGEFWVDNKNQVFGSTIGIVEEVKSKNEKITWKPVDGAVAYQILQLNTMKSKVFGSEFIPVNDPIKESQYKGNEISEDGHYFISAQDKYGYWTPPVNDLYIEETIPEENPIEPEIPQHPEPDNPEEKEEEEVEIPPEEKCKRDCNSILNKLKLGDYVQFGKHINNEPMLWNVVKKDNEKVMLFMTEPIKGKNGEYLQRPFDLKPNSNEPLDMNREWYGSNNYAHSDIRNWLNKDFYNPAFHGKKSVVDTRINYALAEIDSKQASSGNTSHIYNPSFSSAVQNYNTAYKGTVTDKVFLVSIDELVNIIEPVIGGNYHNLTHSYWTRDAYSYTGFSSYVRFVQSYNSINMITANSQLYVRAAINIDETRRIRSGNGTLNSPYMIK